MLKLLYIILFNIFLLTNNIHASTENNKPMKKNNPLNLSIKELNYIKNNPVVKIGGGESFEPFIFRNSNGVMSGIDRDVADIIEEKTGLKIEFELGLWSDIQKRAFLGELDGLSAAAKTEDRIEFYNFPDSYLEYTGIVIINKINHGKISNKNDIQNKKVAIQKDNTGFTKLAKSLGNVEIINYDTIYEVLESVVKNEVDFTVLDESIFYIADKLGYDEFIETSFVLDGKNELYFPITKAKPELSSIFGKAMSSINAYQKKEIKNRWFKTFSDRNITLSNEEKEYLYAKDKINICIDPNWYPYEKIENKTHIGMSADFLKLFKDDIKIPFNLISTKSWNESLHFIENKKCDLLTLSMKTERREEFLSFTKPYLSASLVIATKEDIPFIDRLELLRNKKVGIVKNYSYFEKIKHKYPNLQVVSVKNKEDGLEKVEDGELFGFIDALPSIRNQFQNNLSKDLKVSGYVDANYELSIATRNDDLILLSIFEKLIENISTENKQAIIDKYVAVKYQDIVDYSLVYKIIALSVFIILFILFWTFKIRKDKEKILSLYSQLGNEKKKIDNLYLKLIKKDNKLEEVNRELEHMSSTDKLTNIFNRRKIDEFLIYELERSKRTQDNFCLVMIDIDHFKEVNDSYGHQVGDEVLLTFSSLIKENIRKVDILGRWGGEEFLIIAPKTNRAGIKIKIERLRKIIEDHNFEKVGCKTASFGITEYRDSDNLNTILKRVDSALYKAKNTGRNKIVFE